VQVILNDKLDVPAGASGEPFTGATHGGCQVECDVLLPATGISVNTAFMQPHLADALDEQSRIKVSGCVLCHQVLVRIAASRSASRATCSAACSRLYHHATDGSIRFMTSHVMALGSHNSKHASSHCSGRGWNTRQLVLRWPGHASQQLRLAVLCRMLGSATPVCVVGGYPFRV
jgi:hypothetical protein